MYQKEIQKLSYEEWEYFAQDVLFYLGFTILEGPSEGPDAGLDMKVEKNNIYYLVSCKHLNKNVGVGDEQDIRDRIESFNCQGFITFYSTYLTTPLKSKLKKLKEQNFKVIEFNRDDILDIIPHMTGWTLQKYFPKPHKLIHHINKYTKYKPLECMEDSCHNDLLQKDNISSSLASLMYDNEKKELNFVYGCKSCINQYLDDSWEWIEITQARYIEQILTWRALIDEKLEQGYKPHKKFYKNWAKFQEAIFQILIPIGWGRWLPD